MPKQVQITEEVRDVLSRSRLETVQDSPVIVLPPGQLPRDLYVKVDQVLKALGGKWDRRAGGHRFADPPDGALAEALASGRAVDQKRTAEQFFTPERLARRMAEIARVADGDHVLEPSAGAGVLVNAAMERGGHVTAVELDERLIPQLREVGQQRLGWLRVCHADFMEWEIRDAPPSDFCDFSHQPNVVLMNPPFSRGQDMAHVGRALGLLAPGGVMVAVMSPHWTFALDRQAVAFRDLVRAFDHAWETLPAGTFREAGTGVNTGLLTIFKEG